MNKSKIKLLPLLLVLFTTQAVFSATYTVTKTADSNDGVCNADCSLREAISVANGTVEDDIVSFDPTIFSTAQTVSVTLGEIVIGAGGTLTINGTGADILTIDGNNNSRIISTGPGVIATINDATFTGGTGAGAANTGRGGAIFNTFGNLTLNNLILTNNSAANGGALNNSGADSVLNINNCIISNNTATGSGGGIQNFSSSFMNIENSTIIGNTSGSSAGGGGGAFNGNVTLTNSTFVNNNAAGGSGGGFNSNGASMIINNITVSGNTSTTNGGGIHRATTNVNIFIRNSIVSGNNGAAASPDVTANGSFSSEGNNIIGNVGTSSGWVASDLLNTDPLLSPLADNGGFGMTFLPMAGSPAIDAGQNCVVDLSCATNNPPNALTTDQRGIMRPSGTSVDIGSVEVNAVASNVSVGGRVLTSDGQPISRTFVSISDSMGVLQTVQTNNFGYFRFNDILSGQTYTVSAFAKQLTFAPQVITVNNDINDIVINPAKEMLKNTDR